MAVEKCIPTTTFKRSGWAEEHLRAEYRQAQVIVCLPAPSRIEKVANGYGRVRSMCFAMYVKCGADPINTHGYNNTR
ncbi:hypothetical protein OUZ56_001003 [Daphnia magna]|uniref:Uncharacterized protein n=1 Tax=Daphnia magna TaxID=35525 RepID=A0ABR0A225_9CRUS|nr:hypothetical protein OUZ56_001003 [Daphnia magna]